MHTQSAGWWLISAYGVGPSTKYTHITLFAGVLRNTLEHHILYEPTVPTPLPWRLKATIKENKKIWVRLIAFLTLGYHISILNFVQMFFCPEGDHDFQSCLILVWVARVYNGAPTPTLIFSNFLCISWGSSGCQQPSEDNTFEGQPYGFYSRIKPCLSCHVPFVSGMCLKITNNCLL